MAQAWISPTPTAVAPVTPGTTRDSTAAYMWPQHYTAPDMTTHIELRNPETAVAPATPPTCIGVGASINESLSRLVGTLEPQQRSVPPTRAQE